MPVDKLNTFICEHCGRRYAEPYINCPGCFQKIKEIKMMETRKFKFLSFGILLLLIGLVLGLVLKGNRVVFGLSTLSMVLAFYCIAKTVGISFGIKKLRLSMN